MISKLDTSPKCELNPLISYWKALVTTNLKNTSNFTVVKAPKKPDKSDALTYLVLDCLGRVTQVTYC